MKTTIIDRKVSLVGENSVIGKSMVVSSGTKLPTSGATHRLICYILSCATVGEWVLAQMSRCHYTTPSIGNQVNYDPDM